MAFQAVYSSGNPHGQEAHATFFNGLLKSGRDRAQTRFQRNALSFKARRAVTNSHSFQEKRAMATVRTICESFLRPFRCSFTRRNRRRIQTTSHYRPIEAEVFEDRALLAAGALDTTFRGGTVILGIDPDLANYDTATAMAIQSDGKILLAGDTNRGNGNRDFAVARLNSNGEQDLSFGNGGRVVIPIDMGGRLDDRATAIAVQRDGKIVIAGFAGTATGTRFVVVRLNSNGSLDTSFAQSGRQLQISFGYADNATASGLAIQSDGKIVVVGYAQIGFKNEFAVARLKSNGSLDRTFSQDGLQTIHFDLGGDGDDRGNAVVIQPNGRILLAGRVERAFGGNYDFGIARLTTSGQLDNTFDGDGLKSIAFDLGGDKFDSATSITMSGSKIVVAGTASYSTDDSDFAVVRLTSRGSLDSSFDSDGKKTVAFDLGGTKEDQCFAVRVQSDGKVLLAGEAWTSEGSNFAVARLNTNGTLDSAFNGSGKRTGTVGGTPTGIRAMQIQSNGRIVLAGFAPVTTVVSGQGTFTHTDFLAIRLLPS